MNASWQYPGTSFECSVRADSGGCYLPDKWLPLPQDETASDIVCCLIFAWEKQPHLPSLYMILRPWWWRNISFARIYGPRVLKRVTWTMLCLSWNSHLSIFNNQCLRVDIIVHSGIAQTMAHSGESSSFWYKARKVVISMFHEPPKRTWWSRAYKMPPKLAVGHPGMVFGFFVMWRWHFCQIFEKDLEWSRGFYRIKNMANVRKGYSLSMDLPWGPHGEILRS